MRGKSLKIVGDSIYLRLIRMSDVTSVYVNWLNDPMVNRYLESRFVCHTLSSLKKFVSYVSKSKENVFFAICLNDNDQHIGNIKIGPIDFHHLSAHVGIIIGEKDCWGRGIATEAITLGTEYAFTKLNLHKLIAGCYANNKGSAKAFLKAGYKHEATRPAHWLCDGKYVDDEMFGIINKK